MGSNVYINLPVAGLERSRTFFSSLGFSFADPDGPIWQPFWFDKSHVRAAQ